jgi:hypothetical protein
MVDACGCDGGFEIFDEKSAEEDSRALSRTRTGRHDATLVEMIRDRGVSGSSCWISVVGSASSITSSCARAPDMPFSSTLPGRRSRWLGARRVAAERSIDSSSSTAISSHAHRMSTSPTS